MNVTDVPAHTAPEGEAAILTLTGRFAFTVIVPLAVAVPHPPVKETV
jgi:hypothetical protein